MDLAGHILVCWIIYFIFDKIRNEARQAVEKSDLLSASTLTGWVDKNGFQNTQTDTNVNGKKHSEGSCSNICFIPFQKKNSD